MFLNPSGSVKLNLARFDIDSNSLPLSEFKYKRWDWAYEKGVHERVRPILEKMFDLTPNEERYKWVVDYKVRDLKAGDCGCPLDFWHLDVTKNPNHPTLPDIHFLFATEFGTEFITTPMSFSKEDSSFEAVLERNREFDYLVAEPNTISSYTRFNLHRGPVVNKDCRRLLLRLTLTEVIK